MNYRAVVVVACLAMSIGVQTAAEEIAATKQKPAVVTIGLIPIVDVAPVYIGIKQGFFTKEGLDLRPTFGAGGAAIVPSVISGSIDIGYSNSVSLLTAVQKGLPLEMIAPGSQVGATQDKDHCFLYVKAFSGIKAAKDLEGKLIAVNTVKNLGDVSIKSALEAEGVNPASLKFVEIPFPDMEVALESGRVDATWPCEPFVTTAADAGQRRIIGTLVGTMPNLQFSGYFVSQEYAKGHADVIKRFQRAMSEALVYAQGHPEELRAVTMEYAKVSPDVAKRMILPVWTVMKVDRPSLTRLSTISVKYGVISRAPDLDKLVNDGH
jgi:NitT/TauT family transport system substrate-binding protein